MHQQGPGGAETGARRTVLPAHALGGARQVAEGGAEGVVRGRESAHALAIARHGDGNRGARAINVAIGWMSVGVRRPSPASGQPRATIAPVFARVCGVEGWTTMLICCDEQQNRILRTVGKLHRPDRVASGDGSVARVFQPLIKRAPLSLAPSSSSHTAMSPAARVVYLEDLEAPTNSQSTDGGARDSTTAETAPAVLPPAPSTPPVAAPGKKSASKEAAAPKTAVKRQATLTDLFSGSAASQPDAKRMRLDKSGSSASTAPSGAPRTLNAIPFSLTEYVASLSDNERRLLALECDGMGKSWYVAPRPVLTCHIPPMLTPRPHRLKVLKDEIRKPYFINLKEFLWKEGVKGPDDVPKTLTIYPARKWKLHRAAISILTAHPAQNIYSWSNLTPLGRVKVVIIGQDPYHGPNQAHGTHGSPHRLDAFSSPRAL